MLDKYFPLYIAVFLMAIIFTAVFEKKLIPILKSRAKQPIYTEGPGWHVKKSGTPTMGGLAFICAAILSSAIALIYLAISKRIDMDIFLSISISLSYAMLNALIGIIDDTRKLSKKQNEGLTPRQKLLLQTGAAILFLLARRILLHDTSEISFSFGTVELGMFYYPIALFILIGIVNSANLTDGIDGLASSVAFAIGVSLFYVSAALNLETSIISAAIVGITIGFLFFNIHPAKIFMGDTGSLFLGALISSCAFMLKNPLLLILFAGVYVVEGVSVVIQVLVYKLTHKRVFKMAPLHHHLEKCGFTENKICIAGIIATLLFSIPVYIIYLP